MLANLPHSGVVRHCGGGFAAQVRVAEVLHLEDPLVTYIRSQRAVTSHETLRKAEG